MKILLLTLCLAWATTSELTLAASVQRLQRDVSHLTGDHLPPLPKLSNQYLPPPLPKLSNQYLPPAAPAPVQEEPEQEEPEAPATEAAPAEEITTEAPTEAPATNADEEEAGYLDNTGYHYTKPEILPDLFTVVDDEEPKPEPEPEVEAKVEEVKGGEDDTVAPLVREYLPPLEEGVVVAEGPGDESSLLAEDGYHYRTIRRVRF